MSDTALLNLLNLSDSGFPTGSFGHSGGLEYAIQAGWVTDGDSLADWARGVLAGSFLPLDVRAAAKAWSGSRLTAGEWQALNAEVAAFRSSQVQRRASAQVGRSFLRSVTAFYPGLKVPCLAVQDAPAVPEDAVQFPLAWGSVCRALDIGLEAMAEALVFSALRQMTMVAIRVVPMGQNEAFSVQTHLLAELKPGHAFGGGHAGPGGLTLDWAAEARKPLESFAPALDLAGLGMDNLTSKYFRS